MELIKTLPKTLVQKGCILKKLKLNFLWFSWWFYRLSFYIFYLWNVGLNDYGMLAFLINFTNHLLAINWPRTLKLTQPPGSNSFESHLKIWRCISNVFYLPEYLLGTWFLFKSGLHERTRPRAGLDRTTTVTSTVHLWWNIMVRRPNQSMRWTVHSIFPFWLKLDSGWLIPEKSGGFH